MCPVDALEKAEKKASVSISFNGSGIAAACELAVQQYLTTTKVYNMQNSSEKHVSTGGSNTMLYAGWISVADKLPNDGDVVLCFEDRKCNQFVTQYIDKESGFQEEWYEKCVCTIDGNIYDCKANGCKGVFGRHPFVTHWMPLPPSPCV